MVGKFCKKAAVGTNLYNSGDEYQKQGRCNSSLYAASIQDLILIYTSNKTVYMCKMDINWQENVAEMLL